MMNRLRWQIDHQKNQVAMEPATDVVEIDQRDGIVSIESLNRLFQISVSSQF